MSCSVSVSRPGLIRRTGEIHDLHSDDLASRPGRSQVALRGQTEGSVLRRERSAIGLVRQDDRIRSCRRIQFRQAEDDRITVSGPNDHGLGQPPDRAAAPPARRLRISAHRSERSFEHMVVAMNRQRRRDPRQVRDPRRLEHDVPPVCSGYGQRLAPCRRSGEKRGTRETGGQYTVQDHDGNATLVTAVR